MRTYAAQCLAGRELDVLVAHNEPDQVAEAVVTGTIVGEALLTKLPRLALATMSETTRGEHRVVGADQGPADDR